MGTVQSGVFCARCCVLEVRPQLRTAGRRFDLVTPAAPIHELPSASLGRQLASDWSATRAWCALVLELLFASCQANGGGRIRLEFIRQLKQLICMQIRYTHTPAQ